MSLDAATDDELGRWFDGVLDNARSVFPGNSTSVSYGASPEQVIDLWGDRESPTVIISIHGGYFAAPYDRTVNEPLARRLATDGFYVANIEYRRAGSCDDPHDTIADVRQAISWLVRNVAAGHPVVLIGHSAGGYLALQSSAEAGVTTVLAVAPITRLVASAEAGLDEGALTAWIGSDANEARSKWESLELATDARLTLPVVLVHGVVDAVVPIADSRAYVDLSEEPASRLELVEIPDCGHYEFLDPKSLATDILISQVARILS